MARNKYPEETVQLILDVSLHLFIEKGYENTSIQDIINHLGGLSKGAIYHHFKSKEAIFEAVCVKLGGENAIFYNDIRDDTTKNGREKLKTLLAAACANPNNDALLAMTAKMLESPKFLMNLIEEAYHFVAPFYIEPILRQGIADGSIQTDSPKELATLLITMLNIWINPMIAKTTPPEMEAKIRFMGTVLCRLGIDVIDETIVAQYVHYCVRYHEVNDATQ